MFLFFSLVCCKKMIAFFVLFVILVEFFVHIWEVIVFYAVCISYVMYVNGFLML